MFLHLNVFYTHYLVFAITKSVVYANGYLEYTVFWQKKFLRENDRGGAAAREAIPLHWEGGAGGPQWSPSPGPFYGHSLGFPSNIQDI